MAEFEGSDWGLQEIHGKYMDMSGLSLFTKRDFLPYNIDKVNDFKKLRSQLSEVVVGVDPSYALSDKEGTGDSTGIIVAGRIGNKNEYIILADETARLGPDEIVQHA